MFITVRLPGIMSKAQFTKLSEAEIEELKQAFAAFDKDGSGSITGMFQLDNNQHTMYAIV